MRHMRTPQYQNSLNAKNTYEQSYMFMFTLVCSISRDINYTFPIGLQTELQGGWSISDTMRHMSAPQY